MKPRKRSRDTLTGRLSQKMLGRIGSEERSEKARRIWQKCNVGILVLQIAMVFSALVFAFVCDLLSMEPARVAVIVLDEVSAVALVLMFQSTVQNRMPDGVTTNFSVLSLVASAYIYLDCLCHLVDGTFASRLLNIVGSHLRVVCAVLLMWLFWRFLRVWDHLSAPWVRRADGSVNLLTVAAILLTAGNLPLGYYFTISETGSYLRNTDTYFITLILPGTVLAFCIVYIFRLRARLPEKLILLSYPLLPFIGSLLTVRSVSANVTGGFIFVSVFFLYSNICVRRERELQIKQKELAEAQLNSMLLQINPHFIYNTIGSAVTLCREDGARAEQMLMAFSTYLRNNFGEMAHRPLVPFVQEIEHLKTYVAIEQMRFPDVEVVFDLAAVDFLLPGLTVQPLVENAITHGIMGRESGGRILVTSREEERCYLVTVEDNGIGFDKIPKNDGRAHLGIANVESRLRLLCGGTLRVEGKPGVGTVATIRIPKED